MSQFNTDNDDLFPLKTNIAPPSQTRPQRPVSYTPHNDDIFALFPNETQQHTQPEPIISHVNSTTTQNNRIVVDPLDALLSATNNNNNNNNNPSTTSNIPPSSSTTLTSKQPANLRPVVPPRNFAYTPSQQNTPLSTTSTQNHVFKYSNTNFFDDQLDTPNNTNHNNKNNTHHLHAHDDFELEPARAPAPAISQQPTPSRPTPPRPTANPYQQQQQQQQPPKSQPQHVNITSNNNMNTTSPPPGATTADTFSFDQWFNHLEGDNSNNNTNNTTKNNSQKNSYGDNRIPANSSKSPKTHGTALDTSSCDDEVLINTDDLLQQMEADGFFFDAESKLQNNNNKNNNTHQQQQQQHHHHTKNSNPISHTITNHNSLSTTCGGNTNNTNTNNNHNDLDHEEDLFSGVLPQTRPRGVFDYHQHHHQQQHHHSVTTNPNSSTNVSIATQNVVPARPTTRPRQYSRTASSRTEDSFGDDSSYVNIQSPEGFEHIIAGKPVLSTNTTPHNNYNTNSKHPSPTTTTNTAQTTTTTAIPNATQHQSAHVIPSLYTIRPVAYSKTPTNQSCYVDLTTVHAEGCSATYRFARDAADPCTCGTINLKEQLQIANTQPAALFFGMDDDNNNNNTQQQEQQPIVGAFDYTKDGLKKHDHHFLQAPHGAISSSQITLEQKNNWLMQCLNDYRTSPLLSPDVPTHIRMFTQTFNYYDAIPTTSTIQQILPGNILDFELFAFSFQECGNILKNPATPQQVINVILHVLNNACEIYSKHTTQQQQNNKKKYLYKVVSINHLQSLFTIVIARNDIYPLIHHVQTQTIPTGFMDMVGNKGGVIIRFFVATVSFCIVGCHFNAGQNEVYKRNSDYHRINAKCNLGLTDTVCWDMQMIKNTPEAQEENNNNLNFISSTTEGNNNTTSSSSSSNNMNYSNMAKSIASRFKYNHIYSSIRISNLTKLRVSLSVRVTPPRNIDGKIDNTLDHHANTKSNTTHGFDIDDHNIKDNKKKDKKSSKKSDSSSSLQNQQNANPESFYEYKSDIASRNDITIWLGDLNYRIGGQLYTNNRQEEFNTLLQHQHTSLISRYDQLLYEKDIQNTIFHGFKEGIITHPPTYKYDVQTQEFDTSIKKRNPSWTDRILYSCTCSQCYHDIYNLCDCKDKEKCQYEINNNSTTTLITTKRMKKTNNKPCQRILLERYGSFQSCMISDHRPVFSYFYINLSMNVNGGNSLQ